MDWLDLLAVQGTLKSLIQHHSWKASVLRCSAFFIVQLSHPYMTTGKTMALTRWTFVGQVMSLPFDMLSRLVIAFLPRSKCLLISWLQSPPSAVILEPPQNKVSYCFHPFAMKSWERNYSLRCERGHILLIFMLHILRFILPDSLILPGPHPTGTLLANPETGW